MADAESDGVASAPPDSVESDPSRRYWRFEDVLGSGACKTVFKAFDSREGIEVAWNKVSLYSAADTSHITTMRKRLFSEIQVLKRLQHKNIMTFHDSWIDPKTNCLNFITELFTDGSLKRFRAKHRHLELQVLKKWAWQILQGLVYLHGHDPPIIHRDLKCDNIFINGVSGDIKIGDLGLATLWTSLAPLSVIGTPEFMAPELYNENYDEKVDVYAFGMLLLELVSMDYPYCECTNPASIYKRVSQGVYPASFQKITNSELKEFIELCIAYEPEKRPEARQLLKHQFFSSLKKSMEPHRNQNGKSENEISSIPDHRSNSEMDSSEAGSVRTSPEAAIGSIPGSTPSSLDSNHGGLEDLDQDPIPGLRSVPGNDRVNIKIECTKGEGERILDFSLEYQKQGGTIRTIKFPFNIDEDTADQIVLEMRIESAHEIPITEEEAMTIGQLIGEEVDKWRVKDEAQFEAYVNIRRKSMVETSIPEVEISGQDSDEVRMRLESKVEDLCETMAAGQGRSHYFKALDEHSSDIMDCMDSSWRTPQKLRILTEEDSSNLDTGLDEEQVLFSNPSVKDLTPGLDSVQSLDQLQDEVDESKSEKAIGVEIPKKRRMSETLERSNSISSTFSESRLHHSLEAANSSPFAKSVLRRWSKKNIFTREFQPSNSVRSALRTTLNSTKEGLQLEDRSMMGDQASPEVSFVYLEPSISQGETSISEWTSGGNPGIGLGKPDGSDLDLAKPQATTNPSLISLIKVKPSTPGGGGVSPLTELTLQKQQEPNFRTVRKSFDLESAKTKADEYAWKIANAPLVPASEGTCTSQQLTPENSPRSSHKYLDSNATVSSTELCARSQELPPLRDSDSASNALKPLGSAPVPRQDPISEELFQDPPSVGPDSIRAFRKNSSEGRTSELRKTIQVGDRSDLSVEAKHNLDRMFKSYADLPNAMHANSHHESWDANTKGPDPMFHFDSEIQGSSSAIPHLFGSFSKTGSVSNLPVHSNHQGLVVEAGNHVSAKKETSSDASGSQKAGENNLKKEIRRRQAEEVIDRMQEQQLEGLCSGKTTGVGRSRSKGQRTSMNGSVNL